MAWWQYLLLVNLYLVLFYGFYAILLRAETFFHLNRAYLVTSSLLSFFIPLIRCDWISKLFITQRVQQTISVYAKPITVYQFKPIEEHHFTIGNLIVFIYAAGAFILAVRLIGQLISLKRIIDEPESNSAFSFFKNIRLGTNLGNQAIIEAHERVHVKQWHSADVMLIEAIAIINWFNPVVYLYKLAIKHIHEFIADRQALKNGTTKTEYALLLLSQTLKAPANELVTPFFNHSLLKMRILMLQKSRSKYIALVKYGLSAPLFMLMLVLSSAAVIRSHTIRLFNNKAEEVLLTPAASLAPKIKDEVAPADTKHPVQPKQRDKSLLKAGATRDVKVDPIFISVEKEPQFRGGMIKFYQFLAENLQYPKAMMRYNVQGKVFISLTVEKDGSLTDIKSIRDIGYGSAEEAIRVLKLSPKWDPGYQNGRPMRVRYTLPISFALVRVRYSTDTVSKVTFNYKEKETEQPSENNKPSADSVRRSSMIMGNNFDFRSGALILLDGKAILDINAIDPSTIQSIKILKNITKDNVYYVLYGSKALLGVVLVESKKPPVK